MSIYFSRRDFLKISTASALGMLLPELAIEPVPTLSPNQQGRVTDSNINVYNAPSIKAKFVTSYWKDYILPIVEVVIGNDTAAYNRVWYRIGENTFVYSGSIQPVMTILNDPVQNLPADGTLAEATVPYTDARWEIGQDAKVAYRLYYRTTHWVIALEKDASGNAWYNLFDDKWGSNYFAQANHLRIIPIEELAPLSPSVPDYQKRIEVHLTEQIVIAYEKEKPVFITRTSTGGVFRDGTYTTPTGHFIIFHKRPYRHMAAGDLASNGYDLPGVPWVCYIKEDGLSFHGTYWHNDFGHPRSHGCINVSLQAAKWLYCWTQPVVPTHEQYAYKDYGTSVDIYE